MTDLRKLDPRTAHEHAHAGEALLICAYDDGKHWPDLAIEDAIPLQELRAQRDSLAKDRELIFYCN